jgi:hypothetical protein
LMNAHNGRVDHLDGCIMGISQCVHDSDPHASPMPANEAIIASGTGAKWLRQIAPRCCLLSLGSAADMAALADDFASVENDPRATFTCQLRLSLPYPDLK